MIFVVVLLGFISLYLDTKCVNVCIFFNKKTNIEKNNFNILFINMYLFLM